MSNWNNTSEHDTTQIVVVITDFLRHQLETRTDLVLEDRDCLQIAVRCLEMAYGLDASTRDVNGHLQYRFARPLIDIFTQISYPVSVRDKLRADAYKDGGNADMMRSMYSAAEAAYTRAIELDRWNSIYYANRASSRIGQRNFFDAISDCRQGLLLNPDYAKAHARMGQAYAMIHRPSEAVRCFRQALELEPDNMRYRNNLAVAVDKMLQSNGFGLIPSVQNSVVGMRQRTSRNNGAVVRVSSWVIIREHHPPTRSTVQVQQNAGKSQERSQTRTTPGIDSNNIEFLPRQGVFDEDADEQPAPELNIPPEVQSLDESDETLEFSIEIPLFSSVQDHQPDTCFCQKSATVAQTGEQVEIVNSIRIAQEEIRAITRDVTNQIHKDTTEIPKNDKDSKDTKLTMSSTKITSENPGQQPTMVDTRSVEKINDTLLNGERNVIWNENSKTNSVLKDAIVSIESVVTNVETASQALISTNGKQSEKSSRCSEEVRKNLQLKSFAESKILRNPPSYSDAEKESKAETIKTQQTSPREKKDKKNAENIEQDRKPSFAKTKQFLKSIRVGEKNAENIKHDRKNSLAETDNAKKTVPNRWKY